MVIKSCDVHAYRYDFYDAFGILRERWDQLGTHRHELPPGGRVTAHEQVLVDEQVRHHPEASAHQLRTGFLGPDSTPLGEISGPLANPRV
jgi:hypothetical protein